MKELGFTVRNRKLVPLFAAIFAAVLLFQNCGGMASVKKESSSTQYGGNGSGYDGKIFVHLNDGPACADGSLFDARLEGRGGRVYLTRRDCADIPAGLQTTVQVETNPLSPTIVIFEGRVYHERIMLIDDFAAGLDNTRLMGGNGFTVANGVLTGSVGVLARYKPDGTPEWMKTGPELYGAFKNISPLPSGDFVMVLTKVDGGGAIYKLNSQGTPVWAKALAANTGYTNNFWFSSVAADSAGNIYVAGGLADSISKSSGASLLKFDTDGNLLWARTVFPKQGAVTTAGPHPQFSGVTVVSPTGIFLKGNYKGIPFIARFNDTGAFYWLKSFPGYKPAMGSVSRANHTSALSIMDTTSAVLMEMNAQGMVTSAKRVTPPTGYTSVSLAYLLNTSANEIVATGNLNIGTTQRTGIVMTRDASDNVTSQWEISIGKYTDVLFPKLGGDGIVWAQAHVPFSGGLFTTGIMLRFEPHVTPVCPFCKNLNLAPTTVVAPVPSEDGSVFADQFLTVTPIPVPAFTEVAPGTFAL